MKEMALVVVPLLLAAVALVWRSQRTRPWLLPIGGAIHTLVVLALVVRPSAEPVNAWFGFDPVARAVLPMVSLLFLVCSAYAVAYLRIRT